MNFSYNFNKMKKQIVVLLLFLSGFVVQAETVLKPARPSPVGMTEQDVFNQVALAMTAICITALIFYMVYMAVQKKGFWARRKRQLMKHAE